jgi:hypothetical protein
MDLVQVQEVRYDRGGTELAYDYTLLYRSGNENHELGAGSFVCNRIILAVRRVEFISDRMLYTILKGCGCDVILLNVHASAEGDVDDTKESFYEELKHVLSTFPS